MTRRTSKVREPLNTVTNDNLTPATIQSTGGRIFFNQSEIVDQDELVKIVDTYRANHAPNYGQPIQGSFELAQAPGDTTGDTVNIVAPVTNKVYRVLAINIQNINVAGTATADINLEHSAGQSCKVATLGTIAADTTLVVDLSATPNLFFTKELFIGGVPTAGTANQINFKVTYCELVQ